MSKNDFPDDDPHSFAVLESSLVHKSKILAIRQDQVQMPDGTIAFRDVIEHFGAVAIIAIDSNGQVAMIRQYRHPLQKYVWEIVAGLLDGPDTETALCAAQRELQEEIGFGAHQWKMLLDLSPSPGCSDEAVRIFYATDLYPVERPHPTEEELTISLQWIPLSTLVSMIFEGKITNAIAVAAILALSVRISSLGNGQLDDHLPSADIDFPLWPHALRDRLRNE